MTSRSRGPKSPRFAWCVSLEAGEGAGNAGCALHPRSRVQLRTENAHTSIQVQRRQSGIPCAMALRLTSRSSRRRIPLVTVTSGLRFVFSPVGPTHLRWLDISNGCQNHTTSPYAATSHQSSDRRLANRCSGEGPEAPCVRATLDHSRGEPALRPRSRPTPLRPPHPTPRP